MFADRYPAENLSDILLPQAEFKPFPRADDRAAWTELPQAVREACVRRGEPFLGYEWPVLDATGFLEFSRNGNRSRYEQRSFTRRRALASLVAAECVEDRGRFVDDIVNGIWHICEETYWGVPATVYMQGVPVNPLPDVTDQVVDLFAGETAGLLAWTLYLLHDRLDRLTPLVCRRIRHETKRRITDPYLGRDDFWWMGFQKRSVNNWNPWCNANCLTAGLLVEENPGRRTQLVAKALRSLDHFIAGYHPDGGCDEGSTYWSRAGGSLFDCLELLYAASGGRINLYEVPLVQEIGRFLYRAHIADDYFVNFADGGAKVQIPAALVYLYGRRIQDDRLTALGATAYKRQGLSGELSLLESMGRLLRSIFLHDEIEKGRDEPPYVQDVWLPGIQVMVARERPGREGLYVAAKGGHNAESHNHNDVGNFIVYADGVPVIVDAGVETYSAKTFSPQRYEIWTMQSGYHNVPKVSGVEQQPGRTFAASDVSYAVDRTHATLSLDLANAYPSESGIVSWRRTIRLHRSAAAGCVEIVESFQLAAPTPGVLLVLMTPCRPILEGDGLIRLKGAGSSDAFISFDAGSLAPVYVAVPLEDDKLRRVWGEQLYSVQLRSQRPVASTTWRYRIAQVQSRPV